MHTQFGGRYRLQVFHGDTDILLQDTGWFDNLITNNGLDLLGTGSVISCFVGSSTSSPTESDTSITDLLATSTSAGSLNSGTQVTTAPYYGWRTYSCLFGIGAIQGTIGQVAIGSTTSNLFSKARLTDVNGTPTTLTLGGIDRLTLTYELRMYINTADFSGSLDIDGVTYNYTARAGIVSSGNYHWRPNITSAIGSINSYITYPCAAYLGATALGPITGSPTGGTASYQNDASTSEYVPGSYSRNVTEIWTTGKGVMTNITAFQLNRINNSSSGAGCGTWQFLLNTGINKNEYQNFRLDWQISWARYAI